MKKPCTKPCRACPYRKDSLPGWLGESSGDPEDFLSAVWEGYQAHPCHKTVTNWETENNTNVKPTCAGLLQFWRNNCKLPINDELARMTNQLEVDTSLIFNWRSEFIEHHLRQ